MSLRQIQRLKGKTKEQELEESLKKLEEKEEEEGETEVSNPYELVSLKSLGKLFLETQL